MTDTITGHFYVREKQGYEAEISNYLNEMIAKSTDELN